MQPHTRTEARDYPSDDLLVQIASEIDAAQPPGVPPMLTLSPAVAHPEPLSPCVELLVSKMEHSTFVLSQKRANGELYITVCGKRSHHGGKGVKKVRSTVPWPRTRKTDRLRPVSLHRWVTFAKRGAPPSRDAEATHACGNDLCVAAAHLHWQPKRANRADQVFHKEHPPLSPRTTGGLTRHFSRIEWSE